MTVDTFKMEATNMLENPKVLMSMVRSLSSGERNKQLQDIIVNRDEMSLMNRIYIRMAINNGDCEVTITDSFQVPEFILGTGTSLIVQRCLKLMDNMAGGAD